MIALVVATVLLHGVVRIGPTTPVCRVGVPCDKPAAGVMLRFTRAGTTVTAKTDSQGRYRAVLSPGSWTIRASRGMSIRPAAFVVPRVQTASRNFTIDTGIR